MKRSLSSMALSSDTTEVAQSQSRKKVSVSRQVDAHLISNDVEA